MKKYFLFFILSITLFVVHVIFTKHAVYGDGNGYYSYTQALYFDKSLDFDPIYNYLSNFQGRNYIFSRVFWNTSTQAHGIIRQNPYLLGTGIFWIPSIGFIDLINRLLLLGASRYDVIFELGPGLTGIVLMLAGLYFLERYLLNFFSNRTIYWTILTVFFSTNVLYFTAFEPALSHQPAFFLICFLLFFTYKSEPTEAGMFICGLLSGLLAITRIADTILLLPILFQIYKNGLRLNHLILLTLGFFITISPQLFIQYLMYGSPFVSPYLNGQSGIWQVNLFHLLEYLFSPKRGLFLWSPPLLIGFLGIIKKKLFMVIFSIAILWLVTSSWSAYLSAGFGQRFSFSAIPYFAYGIAHLFNRMKIKNIVITFAFLTIWNLDLTANFYLNKNELLNNEKLSLETFVKLQFNTPAQVLKYIK